jgi:hypothetical protein
VPSRQWQRDFPEDVWLGKWKGSLRVALQDFVDEVEYQPSGIYRLRKGEMEEELCRFSH